MVQARQSNRIDTVAESIIDEVGGSGSAKVLFKGKIIGCDRTLRMGHVYGELIIDGADNNSMPSNETKQYRGKCKIPFKNENIAAYQINADGSEKVSILSPDCVRVRSPKAIIDHWYCSRFNLCNRRTKRRSDWQPRVSIRTFGNGYWYRCL